MTDPHIHQHTEAFYVLEGELTFEVGAEHETITIGAGGFVAAPPGVAHSFRTAGSHPARWLIIHASDGGFAAFMRGIRDGVKVEWDIAPVPPTAASRRPRDRQSPVTRAAFFLRGSTPLSRTDSEPATQRRRTPSRASVRPE